MSRARSIALLVAALAAAAPASAQDGPAASSPPPPGGLATVERSFGLGLGAARLSWDDTAPYDDATMLALSIERDLWTGVRGRGSVARGGTTLADETPVDAGVWSFDLQVLLAPAFGPLADAPVLPYAIGGFGSLVTNPSGDDGVDLPTRSQSQWSYGGGARARIGDRWEISAEGVATGVRLADPLVPENRDTRTIHNIRWEGRLQWRF